MRYRVRVYDDALRDRDAEILEADGGEQRLVCLDCRAVITSRESALSLDRESPERVLFNPAGIVMRVLTVRHATGLELVGGRTDEFTWFDGYTWRIALCRDCGQHLGWLYEALDDRTPASFWGLLVERLSEDDQ